jgi:glutamine synthetase
VKPKAVLAYCREKGIRSIDLRFVDLGGAWKHVTFPVSALTESAFESGFGQEVTLRGLPHEAREQMVLLPIAEANFVDPLLEQPTLVILSNVLDALSRQESWMDSRCVASRSIQYLQSTGIADTAQVRAFQPFSLNRPRSEMTETTVPSSRHFLGCGAFDPDFDFRCHLAAVAAEAGVVVERHYRAQKSTSEVVLGASTLPELCDDMMMVRYLIDQLTSRQGGHLIHANASASTQWMLSRAGEPIFSGASHQGLSEIGWYALGGIMEHAATIAAVALATPCLSCDTEYRWCKSVSSVEPRALCKVILGYHDPRQRSIEFRGVPSEGNPYLQMAAILMAMIDGIQNKYSIATQSVRTRDEDSNAAESSLIATGESGILDLELLRRALQDDSDFLLLGDVFSEALLEALSRFLEPQNDSSPIG